mgnify:CR=1 FL=1
MKEIKKENIDISEGVIYPITPEMQGNILKQIEPFWTYRRNIPLIKSVKYRIEVEYYKEMK